MLHTDEADHFRVVDTSGILTLVPLGLVEETRHHRAECRPEHMDRHRTANVWKRMFKERLKPQIPKDLSFQ